MFDPETCEDREYRCCEAYPPPPNPTPEEYNRWYDRHVQQWTRQEEGK